MDTFLAIMLICLFGGIIFTIVPYLCCLIYETVVWVVERFEYKDLNRNVRRN